MIHETVDVTELKNGSNRKFRVLFKQSHRTQYPSHWPVRWPKGEAWSPVIEDSTHNKWKDERRARWRHGIVGFRASTDPATLPAGCRHRPLSVPHTNVDRSWAKCANEPDIVWLLFAQVRYPRYSTYLQIQPVFVRFT